MSRNNIAESILDAVEHWKKTALLSDGGVFGNERIWSVDCLEELGSVAEQLDNKNFYENLGTQLKQKQPEIIQLAAEICWFVYLCPGMSQSNKREKIEGIWKESGRPFPENSELLSDETLRGIGHGGTAFFVWPRSEFMFFIRLIASLKNLPVSELEKLLSDPWEFAEWIEREKIPEHETRTLRHMILLLLFPDNFERVFSGTQKREIVHKFTRQTKAQVRSLPPTSIDRHILDIRRQEEKKCPDAELDFYGSPLKEKWVGTRFAWTRFYEAVAEKLFYFKDRRDELVAKIHSIASETDAPFALQDRFGDGSKGPLKDICPFTVIGTFNRGISDDNRRVIAHGLARSLGIEEPALDSFAGIPVFDNRNSWLFRYDKDRQSDDIDKLWEVFECAITLVESDGTGEHLSAFKESFNNAIRLPGISWNLTIGLYWISPFNFPTLDKPVRDYISGELGISIPRKLDSANAYLEIRDKLKTKFREDGSAVRSFPELSKSAWDGPLPPDKPSPNPKETATNLILYGPPGTGKTYHLNELKKDYLGSKQTKDWFVKELSDREWFDVIFAVLYDLNKEAKLNEILKHEYVQAKAESVSNKNISATVSTELAEHSKNPSPGYDPREPYVFSKNTDRAWSLAHNWEEECQEQIRLAENWKSGPKPDSSQERFKFVTFHQAYSYEDFVEGIRPVTDEETGKVRYEIVPGVFKRICRDARVDPGQRYAIFIDEINRGNIASIFGELITLIETDKRVVYGNDGTMESGMTLTLPYSGEKFGVPNNLDVYGTMNTADRSIALLDTALRRRFQFQELMPDASVIKGSSDNGLIEDGEDGTIDLRKLLEAVNRRIRFLLSRDMTIGHSYLINVRDFDDLKNVLYSRIIPLLQEYFYDDWHRIQLVFRDVGATGEKLEPQIIRHAEMKEEEIIGFDHDDFEDSVEYSVTPRNEITPAAIRKIYEESN